VLIPGFAALDRKVYHGLPRKSHPIKLKHDPRAEAWASTLCKDVGPGDEEVMLKNWETFSEADRNMCWHLLLLYLLDKRTDRALDFIQVLAHGPPVATLRPEMLADALEHIAKVCVSNMQYKRRHVPRTSDVIPIFSSVYRYHLAKYHTICSQDLFLNLARLATLDDLKHIFDLLVETRAFVGYDTLLHYANTFGVLGDHEYALRCLQRILERAKTTAAGEAVVSRARFRWSCALILRKSIRDGQNYHMTTEIVADFLKLGLKLDILLYNIVMHNAIEAGDYETAFRVYNLLEDNGLEPDPHTYSILLHGCTLSDNPAMFLTFAEHAAKVAEELRNTWIATDYLYYLYVQHYKTDPQNLSHILHQAYSRFFSMGPLRPFFPQAPRKSTDDEVLTETDSLQMDPTPIAMYIMLQSEIRKALSVGNSRQVWELYTLFRALVNDRTHPLLNNLAKAPFIWNAFLLAFCRQQQFSSASELIRTMSDSNSEDIPQPDLYSWNIFMQAFFRNDQVRAAERIFEIMRSRGVEPDQFTYKILLRGYAKAQHIDKLGEVVGHLDKEQQLDPEILRILTKVHDRKKLMLALEESKAAREEEANLKRKEEEEEAKRRWERPLFRRIRGIGEATYTYTGLTDAESSERDSR
jgi:pentatricopeptide repeat protein